MLVHQLFEQQVEKTPDRIAVEFEGTKITYAELNRRANRLAHRLISMGVKPEVRVGLCMERSIEMVVSMYAILKAGGAYVPLDPDYPRERLDYLLKDSEVRILLLQQQFTDRFAGDDVVKVVVDADQPEAHEDRGAPVHNPNVQVELLHPIYMFYTSGSTGKPKGALNTHLGLLNRVMWLQKTFSLTSEDRLLQKSPYSFDVSTWEFFWPLSTGACLVVARPGGHLDNDYLWDIVRNAGITVIQFVPTTLQTFLNHDSAADVPHLRHVFSCGEAISVTLNAQFNRILTSSRLENLYGPTEAAVFITHWTCQSEGDIRVVPIGKPIPENDLYVLDENYRPVAPGEIGELMIAGVGLARAYHNRPDLTAERFVPDPFSDKPGARMYHTGDVGRLLPDGTFECLGRNDDQIKLHGYRIELGEINAVLEQHPHIRQAVTILREDHPGDKRLAAYYIPGEISPSISEIRNFLQTQLPEYMVPNFFVEMQQFPLTSSGKTDRKALPSPMLSRLELGGNYVPPETLVQEELARIWISLFNYDKIGIDDEFIDLGGHSLLGMQIVSRIQQEFLVKVSLRDMLTKGSTIRSLASIVESQLLAQANEGDMEKLLQDLEGLSEEEIEALLREGSIVSG